MPFPLGALLGGLFTGLGSVVGGSMAASGQQAANETNLQMQREANAQSFTNANAQMAFQERMSNTAYQRAMGDMKAAGLNPMLAFSQGGASAPGGAMAQAGAAHVENTQSQLGGAVGEGISKSLSSAFERERLDKTLEQMDASISQQKKATEQTAKTIQEQDAKIGLMQMQKETEKTEQALNRTSAMRTVMETGATEKSIEMMNKNMPAVEAEAALRKKQAGIDTDTAVIDKLVDYVNRVIGGPGSARMFQQMNRSTEDPYGPFKQRKWKYK